MTSEEIRTALASVASETDATVKHLKLASICAGVFAERGIDLVVVGGSAIEFYTEGAYTSGDVDFCVVSAREPLTARLRQELMGCFAAKGGPRSWEIAGVYIDVLGKFESLARTRLRTIAAPYGDVKLSQPEELIVERILVSKYPQDYPPARDCAKKMLASSLREEVEVEWAELKRLAIDPAYANWPEVKELVHEQAEALQIRSPYDSDERAH